MKEKTYEHLRELALIDAKRRLRLVVYKLMSWDVTDRLGKKGEPIGKMFTFQLNNAEWDRSILNLTLNEYATIREIKYIVWRFDLVKKELEAK